ncbi:MAG: hypothetical protein JXA57_17500 [Armatimonadetes bacterium]|nr:hypothetical protein [Armatimonadota bacterium]
MSDKQNLSVSQDTTPRFVLATGHSDDVFYAAFLPDGKTIASLGSDRALILWDAQTGEMLHKYDYSGPDHWWRGISHDGLHAFAFSHRNESLILGTLTGRTEAAFEWGVGFAESRNGRYIAREEWLGDDGRINILEMPGFHTVGCLHYSADHSLACMEFSPDGSMLAVAPSFQGGVLLYDLAAEASVSVLSVTAERLRRDGYDADSVSIDELVFSSDGSMIVGVGPHSASVVWSTQTGETLAVLRDCDCVAFSRDGRTLLSGDDEGRITFRDTDTWEVRGVRKAHHGWVRTVAFSNSGDFYLTAGNDRAVRVWSAQPGDLPVSMGGYYYTVNSIAFTPDGGTLLSGNSDGTIRSWDVASCVLTSTIVGPSRSLLGIVVSPKGDIVAARVRSKETWDDASVLLWDTKNGVCLDRFSAFGSPSSLAFADGGETLLYAPRDGVLAGISLRTAEIRFRMRANRPVAVSPDGRILAVGNTCDGGCCSSLSTYVELRLLETGSLLRTFHIDTSGGSEEPISLAFSPDGRTLAIGHLGFCVSLWNVATGDLIGRIDPRGDSPGALAFSPDGKTLAVGTHYDEVAELFSTRTLKRKRRLLEHTNNVNSVAFSPDGKILATGSSDGTIKLWNPRNGHLLSTLVILPSAEGVSREWLAYTPEGYYTGSENAEDWVRWEVDGTLHPGAQYAEKFRRSRLP